MNDRYHQHIGDSYTVQCEICRRIFDVVIRTKDGVDLCFQCYKEKFGEDDLKRAMEKMSFDMKKSGWNPIEADTLVVGKNMLDNAYELFLAKRELKTVFDAMPKLPFTEQQMMEAGSLLMTVRELTFEQINEITKSMKNDPDSLRKFREICESENQYLLKKNYDLCPRCNIRPLNKPRRSRTESNIKICNICTTNEVLLDISNRPDMTLQDYDDFYNSIVDDLPSRNFEFTHRIFLEEKNRGTSEDLIENIMKQRIHNLERHPTDTTGWCQYCEMYYRKSMIPEEIKKVIDTCKDCLSITRRENHTNEQIAFTIRKHIKKQHKDIYKYIITPESNFFQWDFITPEIDEKRRFAQWMRLHPNGSPIEYQNERTDYVKRHYQLSKDEQIKEDKNKNFEDIIAKKLVEEFNNFLEENSGDLESKHREKELTDILNVIVNRVFSKYPNLTKDQTDRIIRLTEEAIHEAIRNQLKRDDIDKTKHRDNLAKYKQTRNWVMLLSKGSNDIQNDLKLKGGSEKWINSLKNRVMSMTEEERIKLIADLMEHFKKISQGEKKSTPIFSPLFSKDMADCDKCRELILNEALKRIPQKDIQIQLISHIIEKHPEYCLFTKDGTDNNFLKLLTYRLDNIERLISHEIIIERNKELDNSTGRITAKEIYDGFNRVSKRVFTKYPELTENQIKRIVMMTDNIIQKGMEETHSMEEAKNKTSTIKVTPRQKKEYKPKKEYVKYEEFKKFLKDHNIKSIRDFIKFVETNSVPEKFPNNAKSAESYYRRQGIWKGWSSACGIERKEAMTRESVDEILDHILENFDAFISLSDALLLYWFDFFGLFGTKDPLHNAFFKNFIEWKDKEQGKNALYQWLTDRDFEREHYGYALVPKKDETREQFLSRQYASSAPKKEQLFRTSTESIDDILHSSRTFDPVDYKKNPKLFNVFVDFVTDRLMMSYIDNASQQFNIKKNGRRFNDTVIDRFKEMRKIIKNLDYKQKDYRGLEPTILQKYGVFRARKKLGFLNMFGTGSGKTKIGFMLAKHIGAKRVFWISPYNVVNQTNEMCQTDYPESITTSVMDKRDIKKIPDSFICGEGSQKKTRFHFINYEKFNNKTNGKNLISQLSDTKIDLLVLDEGQRVKSRKDESNINERTTRSSNTRQNVLELVRQLRKRNPNMKVLVLTATPIINSIREAMSIYEILTSSTLNMSGANNIKNGMRMYVELLPYSVRFEQKYDIDIIQKPIVCEGFLPDNMSEETAENLSWLEIEQIATKYRIPLMVEEAKRIIKQNPDAKILIYTDLKTGIIDQMVEAFGIHKEFKIGIFSGDDKTGMVQDIGTIDGKRKFFNPFVKGDVNILIATRSIAVGIDGIQTVCNHIFFNGLVWTWADFEQIRGRLVRTGQVKDKVYVNMFFSTINGYPYDLNLKYKRIIRKKGLGELVRDGRLPKDIDTGITKKEKKDFIKTCFKNRISGFPSKEELELKHAEIAQKQIQTEVKDLEEEFPIIDLGGLRDE